MQETWRPVKGYEGLYEISNQGRIKYLERVIYFNSVVNHQCVPRSSTIREHIVKPQFVFGDLYVTLIDKEGIRNRLRVSEL